MPRRKIANPEELLSHNLIVRVSKKLFDKLETLRAKSGCLSIADICRKILTGQKITIYQKDISMNPVMEELAMIRKELKAIGVNINQITRHFNTEKTETKRAFYVIKVAEQYKAVDLKVERLLALISKLAENGCTDHNGNEYSRTAPLQ